MPLPEGGIFQVLLNYISVVKANIDLPTVIAVNFLQFVVICVFGLGVRILFLLEVFFQFLLFVFEFTVHSLLELLESTRDENSFALAARLWLDNKHDWRVVITLLLGHDSVSYLLSPLFLLLFVVELNFVKVCWVDPGLGKKLVLLWKLFLQSLQVDAERVFPRYIVHAEEVVDALVRRE